MQGPGPAVRFGPLIIPVRHRKRESQERELRRPQQQHLLRQRELRRPQQQHQLRQRELRRSLFENIYINARDRCDSASSLACVLAFPKPSYADGLWGVANSLFGF